MTTLISWVGVDSRGPASIYLASDSRITWGVAGQWDKAKKLYTPTETPDLFGYCGDVIYPTQILSNLCSLINSGLFQKDASFKDKSEKVLSLIKENYESFPKCAENTFQIIYASRSGDGMNSTFNMIKLSFEKNKLFESEQLLPKPLKESQLILSLGSGAKVFEKGSYKKWWGESDVKGTSRSIFSALCDSLDDGADKYSGGPPQLIGLYRIGRPRMFGIIWEGKRYVTGIEQTMDDISLLHNIEWRNRQFEICDPITTLRREGAQAQPRPTSLAPKK